MISIRSLGILIGLSSIILHSMEIEKKFEITQPDNLATWLEQKAHFTKNKHQCDRYFDTIENSLYNNGEYIRLRTEEVPGKQLRYILCKKRTLEGTQVRQEDEETIDNPQEAITDLTSQGLKQKVELRKYRKQYSWMHHKEPFAVSIDTITFPEKEQSKTYVEIEYAGNSLQRKKALEYIDAIAKELNLGTSEQRSNLELSFDNK